MKKFHVEIKDNETGSTIVNTGSTIVNIDTDAIIGAVNEDDGTRSIGFTSCNFEKLFNAIVGSKKAIAQIEEKHPELKMLSEIVLEAHGLDGKGDKKPKKWGSKKRAIKDAKEIIEILERLNDLKKSAKKDDECPFEEFKEHTVS